jgi:hypothetical protein
MDVRDRLERAGVYAGDVRVFALTTVVAVGVMTAYGTFAPMVMTEVKPDDLIDTGSAATSQLLAGLGLFLASFVIAPVVGYRLLEHRWVWPFGPRVKRARPSRWLVVVPLSFAYLVTWAVSRLAGDDLFPHLSGLYTITDVPARWLRVYAPIDGAYTFIVIVAVYVAAYVVALAITMAIYFALNRSAPPLPAGNGG